MVKYISDCIGVMYRGKIVEFVLSDEFYWNFVYLYIKVLFLVILFFDFDSEKMC